MEVKKEEIKQWIHDAYTKLRDLVSLYEETDGYLTVPKGEPEEEFRDFISRKIREIRRIEQNFSLYMDEEELAELKKLKPGVMALAPGLAATSISPEVKEISEKLQQIVDDTVYFVDRYTGRCRVNGMVFLWQAVNPHLTYFDEIFDLMEQYPETYREMGIQGGRFVQNDEQTRKAEDAIYIPCEFPGPELVAERNAYFKTMKEQNQRKNLNWSKERMFQEELLKTLELLFEHDFKEYL